MNFTPFILVEPGLRNGMILCYLFCTGTIKYIINFQERNYMYVVKKTIQL